MITTNIIMLTIPLNIVIMIIDFTLKYVFFVDQSLM